MFNAETNTFDIDLPRENSVEDPYLKKLNAEKPVASEAPVAPGLDVAPAGLPMTNRAFPEPPPGYMPGPTSATKMFDEESLMYKVGTTLMSIARQEPMHMKLKFAQQENDRKNQETKLGWDNFYKSAAQATMVMQKQNRDAMMAGLEAMPKLKYQVAAITDPAERQAYAKSAAAWLNSTSPGIGEHLMKFAENPALGYAMDGLAEDPDYGDAFKEIIARVGVPEAYTHPQWQKVAAARNHDMMNSIVLHHFNDVNSTKLHAGKMTEDEFRTAHEEAAKDAFVRGRITQRDLLGMKLYLTSTEGVEQMASKGVQTNKAALAHQIKQKEMSPKERQIEARQRLIDDKDQFALLSPAQQNELIEDQKIAQGLMSPRSNPSDTPNNPFNQRLKTKSRGKLGSLSDIEKLPKKEQAAAYALADQVQDELDSARAQAGAAAQEDKSADLSDVYDLREFRKSGKLVPMMGDVSVKELRSSKDMRKLSPKMVEEIKTYNALNENFQNIFADAKKAYDPDASWVSKKGRTGAEALLQAAAADPTSVLKAELAASAAESYPELAAYLSARESVLGKFARGVSGEVGVLTDQDAGRVRSMFPRSGDSPSIIRAKEKALKRLMDLNGKFMRETVAGIDPNALRQSKEYKDAVNGIFGSVKGLDSPSQSTKTGVDALGDEMAGR